ncbi:MAG: macro domain-containing protein [Armatimonadetes bacterium]|nr:macro domain-containing protein [Armatimonadota bacterium]
MSRRVCCFTTPQGVRLAVHDGDLTTETVDAIVNAANSHLAHGGGVAGAIVRRGGQAIQDESDAWVREHGPVPTGQAALTGAGTLACRAVIHAVGPIWRTGDVEPAQLRSAVLNALALAAAEGFESVALPAISSGIFGFPKERCASVLVEAALEFSGAAGSVREIRFTNFDRPTVEIFAEEFARRFGERLEPGWEEPR